MTPHLPTMRHRFAAQSVIEELLLEHSITTPRTSLARLLGRSPLHIDNEAGYLGAKGEIAVAAHLAKLPPEWTVFHSLPVGTEHPSVDHLVVGPGGIFTITTKHHGGQSIWMDKRFLMVAGRKVNYIREAELEAERVTRLLRERMPLLGSVRPVVAFVDPKEIVIREQPSDVKVIDARDLRRWLTRLPPLLFPRERVELATIIDDPDTWHALSGSEPDELMVRFEALDTDVREAYARRVFWALLGALTIVGAEVVAVAQLLAVVLEQRAGG